MPHLESQKQKELAEEGADVPAPEEVDSSGGPAEEAIQLNLVIRIAPAEPSEEKKTEPMGEKEIPEPVEPTDVAKQQAKSETVETPEVVLAEEKRVREILEFEVNLCKERNLGSMIPKAEELLHVGTPVGEPAEYVEAQLPDGQPTGTTADRSESLIAEQPAVLPEQSTETEAGEPILEASHLNKGPMSDWETELQRLRDSRLHETPHRAMEEKQAEGASPRPSAWPDAGVPTSEPIVIVYERDVLGLLTPEYEIRLKNEREIRLRPLQQQETSTEPTWLEGPAKAEDAYSKSPDIHHVSFPTHGGPPPSGAEKPEFIGPPIEREDMKENEAGAPKPLGSDEEKELSEAKLGEPAGELAEAGQLVERQPSTLGEEEGEKSNILPERTLDTEQVLPAASLTSAEGGGPDEKRTFLGAEKEPVQGALVELPAKPEDSEGTELILSEKQVEEPQEPARLFLGSGAVPQEVTAENEQAGFMPAKEAVIEPEEEQQEKAVPQMSALVERQESVLVGEVVPFPPPVTEKTEEEVLASSTVVEEPKTYGGTSDWDVMSRESLLHGRPSTRTADTQTDMSTDALFRSKDVREASTYAFLSEENEEVRRAPDDYLPLYLHRVTLNDKPSIAEMIRKLTPASEEWEEAVPMNWKVNPAKDLEKWPSPCIQDVRSPIIVLLGGINLSALGEVLTGCLILRYNIEDNEWRRCNMMPLPRYGHRCVFLNNEVYIIGGFDNRDATYGLRMSTSFCFRYHVQTGEWNVTAPLKHARGYHGVAVLNNSIYAVGGVDANDLLLSSVERYDHEEDKWVVLEKGLYCGRMGMGVAAFQGSLWVVGGIVQISGLQTCSTAYVEIYNPATDQWTYAANYLPSPRTCVSLLNVNDTELYCFGGIFYNCVGPTRKLLTIDDILVYSDKKKVWRQVSCMPAPRHNAHVLQYKSEAFVVGGQDVEKPDHPLTSTMKTPIPTERFSWGPLKDVPLPISAYGAVVIPPLEEGDRSRGAAV